MKKYIEGSLPYLIYRYWPNVVRVKIGLAYESSGILGYYSQFKQQNNIYMNSSKSQSRRITSGGSILFRFQQATNIQIPIASELHITYHTSPRFRPSTII